LNETFFFSLLHSCPDSLHETTIATSPRDTLDFFFFLSFLFLFFLFLFPSDFTGSHVPRIHALIDADDMYPAAFFCFCGLAFTFRIARSHGDRLRACSQFPFLSFPLMIFTPPARLLVFRLVIKAMARAYTLSFR